MQECTDIVEQCPEWIVGEFRGSTVSSIIARNLEDDSDPVVGLRVMLMEIVVHQRGELCVNVREYDSEVRRDLWLRGDPTELVNHAMTVLRGRIWSNRVDRE